MSTHPKGQPGWRERDNAKGTARKRRLRAGIRIMLTVGDAINDCARACPPFNGQRVAELASQPTWGAVPTPAAAQWADANRRLDCPRYSACLDAAAMAAADGRLGGLTWRCPVEVQG